MGRHAREDEESYQRDVKNTLGYKVSEGFILNAALSSEWGEGISKKSKTIIGKKLTWTRHDSSFVHISGKVTGRKRKEKKKIGNADWSARKNEFT